MHKTSLNKQEKHCVAIAEDTTLHKILGKNNVYSVCKSGKDFWAYATAYEIDHNTIDMLMDYCVKRILMFTITPYSSSRSCDKLLIKIKPIFKKWHVGILNHTTTHDDVQFYNEHAQCNLKTELTSKSNNKKRRIALLSSLSRVKSVLRDYDCEL